MKSLLPFALWLLAEPSPSLTRRGIFVIFDDGQGNKVIVRFPCLPEENDEFYLLSSHIVDSVTGRQDDFINRIWRVKSVDPKGEIFPDEQGEKYPICKVVPVKRNSSRG